MCVCVCVCVCVCMCVSHVRHDSSILALLRRHEGTHHVHSTIRIYVCVCVCVCVSHVRHDSSILVLLRGHPFKSTHHVHIPYVYTCVCVCVCDSETDMTQLYKPHFKDTPSKAQMTYTMCLCVCVCNSVTDMTHCAWRTHCVCLRVCDSVTDMTHWQQDYSGDTSAKARITSTIPPIYTCGCACES